MTGSLVVLKDHGASTSWLGCPLLLKATAENTAGQLSLSLLEVKSNFAFPPEIKHAEDRVFYVLEGLLNFTVSDQALRAAAGALITIPRGTVYTLANTGRAKATALILSCPAESAMPSAPAVASPMQLVVLRPGFGQNVSVAGDVMTIKLGGERTGGAFTLLEMLVPSAGGPPPHRHARDDEAFFLVDGPLRFNVDGQEVVAPQGSLVVAPKGSKHYFRNESAAPVKTLLLLWPSGFDRFVLEAGEVVEGNAPAAPVTPEHIQKLISIASKYGIEIFAPH